MLYNRRRLQNRILQMFYRPKVTSNVFLSTNALSFLDELENKLEESIAPLLSDLF